jgi:hypothetical protein
MMRMAALRLPSSILAVTAEARPVCPSLPPAFDWWRKSAMGGDEGVELTTLGSEWRFKRSDVKL